jgi:uncharacterized membrane protein YqaE (UPF0057 family)
MKFIATPRSGLVRPCIKWQNNSCESNVNQALKESVMDVIRILFAILLPPLGVFLQVGLGAQFWINIILTLFGYIPGIVHAVYIIATRPNSQGVPA